MFTPLSKGSERAQDKLWDRTNSPRKTRVRPSIGNLVSSPSTSQPIFRTPRLPVLVNGGSPASAARRRTTRQQSVTEEEVDERWMKLFFRVWIWVAIPFPVSDPYKDDPFPDIPSWPKRPKGNETVASGRTEDEDGGPDALPLDVNFYFFLFWYFGVSAIVVYEAIAHRATQLLRPTVLPKDSQLLAAVSVVHDVFGYRLLFANSYASLFLATLPHTSLDAGTWVWSWVITVQLLGQISVFIISSKVRSRALLFLYKLFFQLVYHVFYRNLFARLRSPSQFATVQLISSISTIIIFPIQMTKLWHKGLQLVIGYPQPWEEHADTVAVGFYVRGLAQNVTMLGFLARQVMRSAFKVDVSQVGLDEMREYPELGWASVHVSMNILLFLIKLNFR
ncbi:hypothetical protein P7C73_g3888, partial [Tremellales sp. Uapishka_1]